MRTTLLVILAACGSGGDGDDGGGTLDADATVDGAPVAFAAPCKLTESETFLDLSATADGLGFELKWRKAIIAAPGTYPTGGIVDDIVLFALVDDDIRTAMGSVTFTTYTEAQLTGTFMLTAANLTATGRFDCPR